MFNQKESELNPKEPKRNRNHDLAIVSLHFLDQFLSLSLFSKFWCFSWFRKLPMHSNGCFLMPWRSRNHPRLILDWFGETHFFMKIFTKNVPKIKITTHKKLIWISNCCPDFCIHIKNNIKSKGVLNISKFYLLDFSKIKICRPTKTHFGARRNRRNAACTELLLSKYLLKSHA